MPCALSALASAGAIPRSRKVVVTSDNGVASIKLASGYKPGDFAINEDATFWSRKPIYYIEDDPEAGNFDVDEFLEILKENIENATEMTTKGKIDVVESEEKTD